MEFLKKIQKKFKPELTGKENEKNVCCPIKGEVISLSMVKDPAFSSGCMGPGVGIIPESGELYSPVAGEMVSVFPTGHAFGIRTYDGMEILIHVGIDTVDLDGKGFTKYVNQGEKVKTGSLLLEFDLEEIRSKGYDTTIMLVVLNADRIGSMTDPVTGKRDICERLFEFQ